MKSYSLSHMSRPKRGNRFLIARRRGQAVRQAILDYIATCDYAPSLREIGEAVGLSSSSTVWSHVRTLREEGKLAPAPRSQVRAIMLADLGPSEVEILRAHLAEVDRINDELFTRVAEMEAVAHRIRDLLRGAMDWGSNPSTAGILDALTVLERCLPEVQHP